MNPFSSRAIRPDCNVYRFHPESTTDQELQQRFTANLIETLRTRRLASVIGPHGTGKTTLLRSIEPALKEYFCHVFWTTLSTERRARWHEACPISRHASASGHSATESISRHASAFGHRATDGDARRLTPSGSWEDESISRHASASGPSANDGDARRLTPSGSPGGCCIVVDGFEQLSWWDRMLLIWHVKRNVSISLIVTSHRSMGPIPVCHRTHWNIEMTRLLAAEKLADIDEPARERMWSKLENRLAFRKKEAANVRELWFAMYDEFETIRQQEPLKS